MSRDHIGRQGIVPRSVSLLLALQMLLWQAAPALATLDAMVAEKATKLQGLTLLMGTTGTAGATTLELHIDGAPVASATIDNTDADGTVESATLTAPIDVPVGSLVELVVSVIPTAGADLVATARLSPLVIE